MTVVPLEAGRWTWESLARPRGAEEVDRRSVEQWLVSVEERLQVLEGTPEPRV